jgi:hypothetical protein
MQWVQVSPTPRLPLGSVLAGSALGHLGEESSSRWRIEPCKQHTHTHVFQHNLLHSQVLQTSHWGEAVPLPPRGHRRRGLRSS